MKEHTNYDKIHLLNDIFNSMEALNMIDHLKFDDILSQYKINLKTSNWFDKEKYKWEAVKCFQDNWNINSSNFYDMLHKSLDKTANLLSSVNHFPRGMIEEFAKVSPEEVRKMFMDLFDESKEIYERIKEFKSLSASLLDKYKLDANNHFQDENAISTYLWLRYPDKYYIYKFGEIKTVSQKLNCDYSFKKGAYANNIRNFYGLYDEINSKLVEDEELITIFESKLTEDCYLDKNLKTLTIDFGFYVSREYFQKDTNKDKWLPEGYRPGLTVQDWIQLLNDDSIFNISSLEIVKRLYDYGGQATCKQLSVRYGDTIQFYNVGSVALAKRIVNKTGCDVYESETEDSRWWPVLYEGKHADKNDQGVFVWKLREELSEAIQKVDLSEVDLYKKSDENVQERGYWWLNANPKIWSFSDIEVGETQTYTMYNENNHKRRIFQNFLDVKPGDLIIGYESNPVKKVVALAKICQEQDGKQIYFEKVEGLSSPIEYSTLKTCPELENMEYFISPQGSLFKLTKGEYEFIMDLIREENPVVQNDDSISYTKKDFLNEVYIAESKYDKLVSVLKNKKNIILQGAPGVGKTFAARRLAYSMMEEKDDSRIEFVQFHQNYSYEDFVMGYKPVDDGFKLQEGIFYRFCNKAKNQPDKDFFFIIDEINRGNMSKIFGELLMLIEKDYRGTKATLAYNGMPFTVPKNLYIIGMMNTADRSLAMIDYALRRRFSFFEMEPGFDSEGFIQYQKKLDNELLDDLIDKVKELNEKIALDKTLGKGFCIGHSYFCGQESCSEEWLREVVDFDILPMLSEYWFDDIQELQKWNNVLHGVFQ